MKTLYILRNAKSSWIDPGLSDFERPLNDRGLRTAPRMGGLMQKNNFRPAIIVSSPAARAKATAQLVKEAGSLAGAIEYDHNVYEASAQRLREIVASLDDAHESAMLVGHNPGLEGLIRFLTGKPEPMPTAALAVIELNIDQWNNIESECGELKTLFRPRQEFD